MTYKIGYALAAMSMCLILFGCAGRQRTETAGSSTSPQPGRSVLVADRSDVIIDDTVLYPRVALPAEGPRYNVTLDEIRDHVQNKTAIFIDARSAGSYASNRVRGAINLPAGQAHTQVSSLSQTVARDQLIIIYCVNPSCGASDMVYEALEEAGFTNMLIYSPGWQALSSAKDLLDRGSSKNEVTMR